MRTVLGIGSGTKYCVPSSNLNNLTHGIVERVLKVRGPDGVLRDAPKPKTDGFSQLEPLRERLVSQLSPTTVVPRWIYPQLYNGRKRALYQRAVASLQSRKVSHKDAVVNTFVKAEKTKIKPGGFVPRVIQPRSARYNVEVGRYLKRFEKELQRGFRREWGYDVILKGYNATQVAQRLRDNWDSFRKPIAVGLDASRFDQHVSIDALKFEHSVYNDVFKAKELAELLRMQLVNRGRAYVGNTKVSYTTNGCRMSGDINTGMGNCLLMSLMVLGYLEHKGLKARLSNNGDDCVVILESRDLHKLDGLSKWFLDLGFTLTQEPVVDTFERIEFCQTQPIWTESGWRMTRNPRSAPSKDLVSLLPWDSETSVNNWRSAIGGCGIELTRGVPFWQSFYEKLYVDTGNTCGVEQVRDSGLGYLAAGVVGCEVSDASRVSFWRAFGMTPDMQLELEAEDWIIVTDKPHRVIFEDIKVDVNNSLSIWSKI